MIKFGEIAREVRETFKGDKSGIPVVGLENLLSGEMELYSYELPEENTFTKSFHKGQILFGRRRAYQKKASVATFDGICSGDITVIEAISGKVLPELLPFIIANDKFFEHAIQGSAGSLSPRVKWEHLASYELDLPTLEQQRVLADKLWAAYRLKEAYKRLLIATDEMVKSQFLEMFGNEKNEVRLIDFCDTFIDGDWIESKDQSPEGIRLIQTGNIGNGFYKDKGEKARFISRETFKRLSCNAIHGGDILVSRLPDPIGRACILPETIGTAITAVDCSIIRLKSEVLPEFFIAYTQTPRYQAAIKKVTTGTTRRRVSRDNLGKINIPYPTKERQQEYICVYRQADKSKCYELN